MLYKSFETVKISWSYTKQPQMTLTPWPVNTCLERRSVLYTTASAEAKAHYQRGKLARTYSEKNYYTAIRLFLAYFIHLRKYTFFFALASKQSPCYFDSGFWSLKMQKYILDATELISDQWVSSYKCHSWWFSILLIIGDPLKAYLLGEIISYTIQSSNAFWLNHQKPPKMTLNKPWTLKLQ